VVSDIPNIYLYCLCRYGFYSKYFSQFANGANVLHLKPGALLNKKVLLPTKDLTDDFVEKVSALIELIDELNLANDNIIKQRDLLLPRLMSGKLEV
jgi:type I restriction enzyme S subunit